MDVIIKWSDIEVKGTQSGQKTTICPICSHTRKKKKDKCLSVNFTKGVCLCFHCGAIGFRDDIEKETKKEYSIPVQSWKNYTKLSNKAVKWFEGRKISQSTLKDLKITEEQHYQPAIRKNTNNIVYNYFEGDVLVNKKYRDGLKNFTQTKGTKSIFYNINSVVGKKECYIVEGENDVLAMHDAGFKNVISVPNGANDNDDYWKNSEKYIHNAKIFYIGVDNDSKGNELSEKIAQRLGRWRCKRIVWVGKDANDDLISGDINKSVGNAKTYPVSGTFKVSELYDGILHLYNNGLPDKIFPKHSCFGGLKDVFSVMRGHLVTVTGIPSHGKALDVNTNIPTANGFVELIDLKVGDTVFDEKGNQCNVKWKSEIFKNRPTYKLTFSDGSTLIADENHEWLTDTWKSRRSKANAKKNNRIIDRELKPKGNNQTYKREFLSIKTTKEIANTIKIKNDNRNNHSVTNCKSIVLNKNSNIIDPYVLGCWLGDGTSANGGFTSADVEIIDNIKRKYEVRNHKAKYHYGIIGVKTKLRKLGVLNNKHIPTEYLFNDEESRFELLRGLMDTDGHCSIVEARNEYCGVNKRLVKDVYSLICSLGIKATFVEGDAILNGQFISKKYRVFFKTDERVYNLERKQNVIKEYFKTRKTRGNDIRYIIKVDRVYGYETQCIEVDSLSHLFLAGHQFIPTHNSNFVEWYVMNLVKDHKMKASFFSPEHSPMELHKTTFIQKAFGKNFWKSYEGVPRISKEEIKKYKDWADEKIYLTGAENNDFPTWGWLLDKFKEQMFCFGIDIFVIDAFNKLDFNEKGSKLDLINKALTKLTMFAQMNNVIIFLVAHPKKMNKKEDGTYPMPTLYDISGSADFRNQTHDGFTIHRYFGDEDLGETGYSEFINTKVKMSFQGEINAKIQFDYHLPSGRYCARHQSAPTFDLTSEQSNDFIDYDVNNRIEPNNNLDIAF